MNYFISTKLFNCFEFSFNFPLENMDLSLMNYYLSQKKHSFLHENALLSFDEYINYRISTEKEIGEDDESIAGMLHIFS